MYDAASNILAQRLSQLSGIGNVNIGGSSLPAVRVELNPQALIQLRHRARGRARRACLGQRQQPEGHDRRRQPAFSDLHQRPGERCRRLRAAGDRLSQRRGGPPLRRRPGLRLRSGQPQSRHVRRSAVGAGHSLPSAERQHHRDRRRREGGAAAPGSGHAGRHERQGRDRSQHHDPRLTARHRADAGAGGDAGHRRGVSVPAQGQRHHHPQRRGADIDLRHLRGDVSARLQPRHSLADGADHRHRLRGRRRDRGDGKHRPPHGRRHAAPAGGVSRRARGRLHRAFDQPVADHGVPADPADGRHSRPAVPRVHRHAVDRDPGVAGDFAHHHADVVRAVPQNRSSARTGRPTEPVRAPADRLRPHADLGAAPQFAGARDLHRHDRLERLSVLCRAQRAFFPSRIPAASSARCRPTKASRFSR